MTIAMRLFAIALFACCLLFPARAGADDSTTSEQWRALGEGAVSLKTITKGQKAEVHVRKLDAKLAATGTDVTWNETAMAATLAVRDGGAAVLMFRGGSNSFVKVGLVDLAAGTSKVVTLSRIAAKGFEPSAAVACADADGFTLLWQETKPGDSSAEAQSAMARIKLDGTVLKAPAQVPIPWSLGAIIDDGRGYTLAVNFDGSGPDKSRLCFVTLTREGQPEQHPWWGSQQSVVDDVELALVSGKVMAAYRGGADGQSILTVTADKTTGQWAKEPPQSSVLAKSFSMSTAYAVRANGSALALLRP